MRQRYILGCVGVLIGGASSAWGAITITTNGDVYVDKNTGATNFDQNNLFGATIGGGSSNPRNFVFLRFALGNTAATDVALKIKTNNTSNGGRFAGGHIYAKAESFDETTLTFDNSFLGGAGGIATTDGSFGQVATFISNAGWTQLDVASGTNALNKLANGAQNTLWSTNPAELLSFYNANLGNTISILFAVSQPLNGGNVAWFGKDCGCDPTNHVPASLSVTEVPEPAGALLLAFGGLLLRRRCATV